MENTKTDLQYTNKQVKNLNEKILSFENTIQQQDIKLQI